MKKTLVVSTVILVVLGLVSQFVLRIPPWHLGDAVKVSTGLGAKLACSGKFISGFSEQHIIDDLATYSPANRLLDIHYDATQMITTASLLGLGETSAKYRPGLGCTLEFGDTTHLDKVRAPEVARSDANWPAGDGTDDILPALQADLEALLAQDNQQGYDTRALVVIKDGKLVAESYASGYDANTPLLGWSMGKSLTAIMLGHLEYLGKVQPQQAGLFADWQDDSRAAITLESLLHMSSGLDFDETYVPGSDSTKMLFTAPSAANVAMQSPAKYAPAEHFSYSSGTTNLLAKLAFDLVGGTAQLAVDFFYQQLMTPLAMADSVFEPDASGVFVGSSYIYASARDWAKLGQLMLGQGEINGHRLLSEDWVTRASSPNSSNNDPRYGYQFWLNGGGDKSLRWDKLPADAYAMNGNRSQIVTMIPSKSVVIVRLGWTTGWYPRNDRFSELLTKIPD